MNTRTLFSRWVLTVVISIAIGMPTGLFSQSLETKIQSKLDSLRIAGNFPGITVALVMADNSSLAFASGFSNVTTNKKIATDDLLMQGSVGKTYVSAIALQLVHEGKLDLAAKVSVYLGDKAWFNRLPNASDITVRMLMNHTSGIMRYEFKDAFTNDLTNQPGKVWTPEELISYVLDEQAPFKAGEGWDYSDTNYIVLGLILEKLMGKPYYTLLYERILTPLGLKATRPTDKPILPGLVQGYAGADNPFGKKNEVLDENGKFIINPQFEWTGGGIYSTSKDLATWAKLLYEGKAFDNSLLPVLLDGVPAKLGPGTKYGLGVIIRESQQLGTYYGHSGYFPGFLAEVYYFPRYKFAIALQTNSSDFKTLKFSDLKILLEIAKLVAAYAEGH